MYVMANIYVREYKSWARFFLKISSADGREVWRNSSISYNFLSDRVECNRNG